MNWQDVPEKVNPIVLKAGELLGKLQKDPEMRVAQRKGDGSPITPTDLALSRFFEEKLAPLGIPVVSEEALPETPPGPEVAHFLIDPLDGTKYYSRGEPEYAICVGLVDQGKPVYGAIYDPIQNRLFWALKGRGAFCDDQKIHHPGAPEKRRVYSSGFHKKPLKDRFISGLSLGDILEKGSALKFCDIALGDVDLYLRFGNISEWDTAGAQILLEEAGCAILEARTLETLKYGKPNYLNKGVIACEKSLVEEVRQFITKLKNEFGEPNP
ncbi:MAG: 3'(2'),5'-bisphosphate nucleotidase CysQ [Pseudomonadota bacterium]